MLEFIKAVLKFINNNGVLFTGVFSIICIMVPYIIDAKKNKVETIRSLKKELSDKIEELNKAKKELEDVISIERAEKSIDKRKGSIYVESLSNSGKRAICGFCWENEHKKIPITVDKYYTANAAYYSGKCNNCGNTCEENIIEEFPVYLGIDDDLPL